MTLLVLNSLVDGTTTLFPLHKKEGSVAALQELLYKFKFSPDSDSMSYDHSRFKNVQPSLQAPTTPVQS